MSGFGDSGPFYGNGGGFLSQGSPYGSGGGSPGGSARQATSHSIRPVTLKQLVEATQEHSDAAWRIGDVELGQITVVAQVLSVQAQTTNVVYMLNDGTARYEARLWINPNNEEEGQREISENIYVRVLGSLKTFGNKTYITATHIRPIAPETAADEIFYHISETAMTLLIFERGPPPRPSEGTVQKRAPATNGTTSHSVASAYTTQTHNTGANSSRYAHLPPLQRQILMFMLSQPKTGDGIHVAAIARHIATNHNAGDGDAHSISSALDTLMDDGLVYSTTDESHFLVSE
ncbi:replication protein A subunit RPA32 [Daedaleopsis nitida]|nr:replication protein A subunit RPA32 [Daedaleopsis nitida]